MLKDELFCRVKNHKSMNADASTLIHSICIKL